MNDPTFSKRIDWRDKPEDRKPSKCGDDWCPRCKRYVEPIMDTDTNAFGEKAIRCCQCKLALFLARQP